MRRYLEMAEEILREGEPHDDRTGTGTRSLFGGELVHDMRTGFPLLTTKQMAWKSTVGELFWFRDGGTHVDELPQSVRRWWQGNAFDDGSLGPIYGRQFRSARSWKVAEGSAGQAALLPLEVDQLATLMMQLEHSPGSRRHIMTSWNAADVPDMALPCCHGLTIQFRVHSDGSLSLKQYQRSADWFLGVPVNIASYALLLELVAFSLSRTTRSLHLTFGDRHIYTNHVAQMQTQVSREPLPLPRLRINADKRATPLETLLAVQPEDLELVDYQHHTKLTGEMSV